MDLPQPKVSRIQRESLSQMAFSPHLPICHYIERDRQALVLNTVSQQSRLNFAPLVHRHPTWNFCHIILGWFTFSELLLGALVEFILETVKSGGVQRLWYFLGANAHFPSSFFLHPHGPYFHSPFQTTTNDQNWSLLLLINYSHVYGHESHSPLQKTVLASRVNITYQLRLPVLWIFLDCLVRPNHKA